jgi:oligopeptidase B
MINRVFGWTCTIVGFILFYWWSKTPVPVAKEVPVRFDVGKYSFSDNYLWLRNAKSDPDVDNYIGQENRYTDAFMKRRSRLIKQIARELAVEPKVVINPCLGAEYTIDSMWQDGDYVYYKTGDLGSFPVYLRRKAEFGPQCHCLQSHDNEEMVLDLNDILPADTKFFMVGLFEVSQDGRYLAFSLDLIGSEKYSLYVFDLQLKQYVFGPIRNTYYSGRWKEIQKGVYFFYYNVIHEQWQVPLYIDSVGPFGSIENPDERRVYEEKDVSYICDLYGSNDEKYLFIVINGQITNEYIEIQQSPNSLHLRVIFPRQVGIKYFVEHHQGKFIIMTSQESPNYQVVSHNAVDLEFVSNIVPQTNTVYLEKMEVFEEHLVLWVRKDSFRKIQVYAWNEFVATEYPPLKWSDRPYTIGANMEIDMDARFYRSYRSSCMLFANSSLSQPPQLYTLNRASMQIHALITTESDTSDFKETKMFARGVGNVSIPLSVISQKTVQNAPLLITAYGAYGGFIEPTFTLEMIPFLSRC